MKTAKFIIFVLVIALIAAIAYSVYIKSSYNDSTSPEIATTDFEGSINDIGELATAEYGYKIAQVADKPNKTFAGFEIPFTSSQVIYSYEGLIKAGIDFQNIEINVSEANKIIYIGLPDIKILSSEVDFDSLIVYDEHYSPFNNFTFEDMNLSVSNLQKVAEEMAVSNGLFERAEENAKSIIRTSIGSFYNLDEYTVEFY